MCPLAQTAFPNNDSLAAIGTHQRSVIRRDRTGRGRRGPGSLPDSGSVFERGTPPSVLLGFGPDDTVVVTVGPDENGQFEPIPAPEPVVGAAGPGWY